MRKKVQLTLHEFIRQLQQIEAQEAMSFAVVLVEHHSDDGQDEVVSVQADTLLDGAPCVLVML